MKEGLVRVQKTPMGYHIHDELDEDLNLFYKVEDASLYTRWSHRILVA